jgi:hypothetical protein
LRMTKTNSTFSELDKNVDSESVAN